MKIQDLYIYPVKSLGGMRVNQIRIGQRGPLYDRWWMLVDDQGKFQTQRTLPQLSQLSAKVEDDARVEIQSGSDFMDFGVDEVNELEELKVQIWGKECLAQEVDKEVSQWVSDQVGASLKLVKIKEDFVREVDEAHAPGELAFADAFPLMILSQQSLDLLNQKVGKALSMRRFRPNVVVKVDQAHEEDQWERISIGRMTFRGAQLCTRCKVTTVDPLRGEFSEDNEPLTTLAEYRKLEEGIVFGKNFVHESQGEIQVGQDIQPFTE